MLKEFSVPAMVSAPTTGNLTDHIVQNAETNPSKVVFSLQRGDAWVGVTAAQFLDEVRPSPRASWPAGGRPGNALA